MPSIGSERATVQNPLVSYATEIGWVYLTTDQALTLRRGESGTLLYQTLKDKLISLNPGVVSRARRGELKQLVPVAAHPHTTPLCTPHRCSTKLISLEMFDGTSILAVWFCSATSAAPESDSSVPGTIRRAASVERRAQTFARARVARR